MITPQPSSSQPFYIVSLSKFTLLYFATAGLYVHYWFYQGFRSMERASGRNLFPLGRTIFAVLFVHELFGFVRQVEREKAEPYPWNPSKLAWLYVAMFVVQVVTVVMAGKWDLGWFAQLLLALLVLLVQYYILYKVQLVINRMEQDSFGKSNNVLTFRNHLWIAFGAFLWFNSIYTTYLAATGQLPERPVSGQPETPAVQLAE